MERPLDTILATVVKWAGDAIEITDGQARIIFVNKAFEDMTGYSLEEARNKTPAQLLRSEHQDPAVYEVMWNAVMTKKHWSGRITRKIKSGEHRPFDITVAPCLEPDGSVRNMIAISRDVSEKVEAEERKIKLREQVAYLQKLESLGRLAGRFAHDFNNLLTVVSGNIEMARLGATAKDTGYLDDATNAINRAADLTHQMLTYAGSRAAQRKNLELNQAIREMEGLFRVPLPKSIGLELDLKDGMLHVYGDKTQLSQVLLNLINNGVEAIGHNKGLIRITTRLVTFTRARDAGQFSERQLPAGSYVKLVVSDDGPGIPQSVIPKIFDPFFSSKSGGHGLGLSSVLGIVKSHGGDISVDSIQGSGVNMNIILPISEERPAENPETEEKPEQARLALVVDDDELVRRVFARGLEAMKFGTLQARDGVEGWDIYQKHRDRINLVVLDMRMPNMDGRELFGLIHGITPDQKVILCSGFRDSERDFDGGPKPNAFLLKPFTIKQLAACVRELGA